MQSKLFRQPFALALVLFSTLASTPVARAGLWTSEMVKFSDADFMTLPPLCRAKLAQADNREIQEQWSRKYGSSWADMHHYCFGLKGLNLAYRDYQDKEKRRYFSTQAVKDFDYVLDRAKPDFALRSEILIQRGRALTLSGSYEDAKLSYEEALKQNPKSVDAWVALSDLYTQLGKYSEAVKVLEQAIQSTGSEHKKISTRLNEIKDKSTR